MHFFNFNMTNGNDDFDDDDNDDGDDEDNCLKYIDDAVGRSGRLRVTLMA